MFVALQAIGTRGSRGLAGIYKYSNFQISLTFLSFPVLRPFASCAGEVLDTLTLENTEMDLQKQRFDRDGATFTSRVS